MSKFFGEREIFARYIGEKLIIATYNGAVLIWQSIKSCFSGFWNNMQSWNNGEGWKNK